MIEYQFSGSADTYRIDGQSNPVEVELSGGFYLDPLAVWELRPYESGSGDTFGIGGILDSPRQEIWGTFGDYSFSGTVALHAFYLFNDYPEGVPNTWIVRADLESNEIDGQSLGFLNLFADVYQSWGESTITLQVPTGNNVDLSFTIGDAYNGSFGASGQLTTLQVVPEPGTLALFAIGLAGIGLVRRRKR